MVLDDYSKFCWVVVLRAKSDTADQLPHLVALCETQLTPRLVQRVRSDRGGEFEGRQLLAFYRSKGIVPETTVGYAPQQNGAAEALVKSINDMGRTMHRGAALPPEQWGMSLKHAAWVRNRLPAAGTGKKTPHELLLGTKPDMHGLRVYGVRNGARRILLSVQVSQKWLARRRKSAAGTCRLVTMPCCTSCASRS